MQPVVVFGQAAIAHFVAAEDLLDVPERMLDLGANTGFDFLGFQLVGIQLLPGTWPFGNEPGDVLAVLILIPLLNAKVTGVPEDSLLFTVQKLIGGHGYVRIKC